MPFKLATTILSEGQEPMYYQVVFLPQDAEVRQRSKQSFYKRNEDINMLTQTQPVDPPHVVSSGVPSQVQTEFKWVEPIKGYWKQSCQSGQPIIPPSPRAVISGVPRSSSSGASGSKVHGTGGQQPSLPQKFVLSWFVFKKHKILDIVKTI